MTKAERSFVMNINNFVFTDPAKLRQPANPEMLAMLKEEVVSEWIRLVSTKTY